MWGLIIKSARSAVGDLARTCGGSAPFRVCLWMPLVQISAQLPLVYGALPILKAGMGTGCRLGTLPASLSSLPVPNFCFCAPFPPTAGWEQQLLVPGGSWDTKDQGWGKRRELITNSSLGGWDLLGEIIFLKLPQSWAL